jgi:hypothetical protein
MARSSKLRNSAVFTIVMNGSQRDIEIGRIIGEPQDDLSGDWLRLSRLCRMGGAVPLFAGCTARWDGPRPASREYHLL